MNGAMRETILLDRTVRLITWHAAKAQEQAACLEALGFKVDASAMDAHSLRAMRRQPPLAVVIDLSRQPSSGRDVAINLRYAASTRYVPLLFVGGEAEKVARIRRVLPDASYTVWSEIKAALSAALSNPLSAPVAPASGMAAYAEVPLPRKLGIKKGFVVILQGAPEGWDEELTPLPEGAMVTREFGQSHDLTLWFVLSESQLRAQLAQMAPFAIKGGLWVIWPKKRSSSAGGLSQALVRSICMAAGLVDFKICSLDDTWSGLQFSLAKRKENR